MIRSFLVLAAVLTMGAAPAPKSAPAKAAAPTKSTVAAKPAAPRAAADLRDPATLVGLLNGAGAKAQVGARDESSVLVSVTSPAANFSAQFADCDRQGRACRAVVFDSAMSGSPTLSQVNGFNQASALCRAYVDKAQKPHVTLPALLFADASREQGVTVLAAWQGCLADFSLFAKDPVAYLASAP